MYTCTSDSNENRWDSEVTARLTAYTSTFSCAASLWGLVERGSLT